MAHSAHAPSWLKFLHFKTDFFELLLEQAQTTHNGIVGLNEWIKGGAHEKCDVVHEMEHKADEQKHDIEHSLHDNFVTPFDREEIYDISARLDLIINGAKRLVKDIELFKAAGIIELDDHLKDMGTKMTEGTTNLLDAIKHLKTDVRKSAHASNESRKTATAVADVYRKAIAALYQQDDLKLLMINKQLYDQMVVMADRTEQLAEEILHLTMKLD